jgi:hypothetical protein
MSITGSVRAVFAVVDVVISGSSLTTIIRRFDVGAKSFPAG